MDITLRSTLSSVPPGLDLLFMACKGLSAVSGQVEIPNPGFPKFDEVPALTIEQDFMQILELFLKLKKVKNAISTFFFLKSFIPEAQSLIQESWDTLFIES